MAIGRERERVVRGSPSLHQRSRRRDPLVARRTDVRYEMTRNTRNPLLFSVSFSPYRSSPSSPSHTDSLNFSPSGTRIITHPLFLLLSSTWRVAQHKGRKRRRRCQPTLVVGSFLPSFHSLYATEIRRERSRSDRHKLLSENRGAPQTQQGNTKR